MKLRSFARFAATKFPSLYAFALRFRSGFNEETRCYLRLIRNGDCVLDVGANYGHYTVLYSHLVGSSGRVYGFEPVPQSTRELHRRIAGEAMYGNIVLSNAAVTDTSGLELTISIPNDDYGQASLATHTHGSWRRGDNIVQLKCQTITLDDYLAKSDIQKVDFIKIDVEGAELLVLKGAANLLRTHRPVIHLEYFEQWSKAFGYSLTDLVTFLESCGYRNFFHEDLTPIENVHVRLDTFSESINLVCSAGPLRPRLG